VSGILDEIVAHKLTEIEAAKTDRPIEQLRDQLEKAPPVRDFVAAIAAADPIGLIAEVKKASPSAGLIREDFDPVNIAFQYESHGASCISVLTDEHFFQGHLSYLTEIRQAVGIPVMRKEFILDPYQVVEARVAGADCVLLIAECLDDDRLSELHTLARDLGMATLIELYEASNLARVLKLKPRLVGINNRNLQTFQTDLQHSMRLRKQIPSDTLLVSESGIRTRRDVEELIAADVQAILVGETLMRCDQIGSGVDELLGR
jgi:indole-3-glycerol phosphate synthase